MARTAVTASLAVLVAVGAAVQPQVTAAAGQRLAVAPAVGLLDVDDRIVDPFLAAEQSRAIVFLFASVDCPISNRYAPVVQRLHDRFAAQGVAFWLVYPNPAETPGAIRAHVKAFNYPVHALRDPRHELVKMTGVSVTPEAAVYDRQRALVYRGRIDDRYVRLGVERFAATQHDLQDALAATLDSQRVSQPSTPAVGCFIADFVY
ncbi:MAG: redoxin domain-containing protein [Luteitalea sp.]|nr:redoxin domain-containing protein [Luteitalea sp.]